VLTGPTEADDRLAGELAGIVPEIHLVGDCVSPRRLTHAIMEGHRVGLRL
jgi:hypothetical protein